MQWGKMEIYQLRKKLGMTQTDFATFVGTRQATISDWESGTKDPSPMARRLLTLLAEKIERDEQEARSKKRGAKK